LKFHLAILGLICCANAASFDCTKAKTTQEILVCGNAELSSSDDRLAMEYKRAKEVMPAITANQKIWIREVRDACDSLDDLKRAYQERIVYLAMVRERKIDSSAVILIGNWEAGSNAPLEQFQFNFDNKFNSWLHNTPEIIDGKWSLSGNQIDVKSASFGYKFKIIRITKEEIILLDMDSALKFKAKRIIN